jgi:phospholipase C
MKTTRVAALFAAAVLLAVAVVNSAARSSEPAGHRATGVPVSWYASRAGIHRIRHVVIIMQENRSFDNYFGTFPHADGIPGLSDHRGRVPCIPDPMRHRCRRPFHDRHDFNYGGPYSTPNAQADINGGKMNGFIAQQETRPDWRSIVPFDDVMGFHTGHDIRNYWRYARNFVLQDHLFESSLGYSLPSHLFLVSLWSARCANRHRSSCHYSKAGPVMPPGVGPNPNHKPPHYAWTDLTYLLSKHHVSWRYYIFKGIEPDCESNATASCAPVTQGPRTNPYWNPLRYFETVRTDHQLRDIQSLNAFFSAANRGTLPAVSWIVPNRDVSEHPGMALVSRGQTYVTGLINTIMQSPDWKSTAIFLSWDDWSGLYDNLRPPHVDAQGYGLRLPGLVISPYAKRGYVDHQTLSFDAYAKFIEDDFLGGQRVNPRTDGRPDPRPDVRENARQLGNLAKDFNFSQRPRRPVLLPVHPKTDLIRR